MQERDLAEAPLQRLLGHLAELLSEPEVCLSLHQYRQLLVQALGTPLRMHIDGQEVQALSL